MLIPYGDAGRDQEMKGGARGESSIQGPVEERWLQKLNEKGMVIQAITAGSSVLEASVSGALRSQMSQLCSSSWKCFSLGASQWLSVRWSQACSSFSAKGKRNSRRRKTDRSLFALLFMGNKNSKGLAKANGNSEPLAPALRPGLKREP